MATADELRAQIVARRQEVQVADAEKRRAQEEVVEAGQRQLLRRELDEVNGELARHKSSKDGSKCLRTLIDSDMMGEHMPDEGLKSGRAEALAIRSDKGKAKGYLDCVEAVSSGEIEWSLKGFSWLTETLEQNFEDRAVSPDIEVCGHTFRLFCHPGKGNMGGSNNQLGSLAINHLEPNEEEGVAFRYTIWIKSEVRGYCQWGGTENICTTDDSHDMMFGPDVCYAPASPAGIFGMSHADLIKSEWVVNDTLTAKLEVQVRPSVRYMEQEETAIVVPPSNLGEKLLLLLDDGGGGDVTFTVQGEDIRAHSQILSACSEVLRRQFACGMQESTSKEVTIEDCDPLVFRAFLRYLYSDSLASLEGFVAENVATQTSCGASSCSVAASGTMASGTKMAMLQQLLAVSHKYQLTRLQLWCERELCECISIEDVCSVLCQAHLYEAKKLEEKCLDFVRVNMKKVIRTDTFASLSQEWPQVSLKITLHLGDVDERDATAAMDKQEKARKRKRID